MAEINGVVIAEMLRQALQEGHQPSLTVTSHSMWPLLRPGDEVTLRNVETAQLQAGDIVTLLCDDHLLTHRFWGLVEREGELCLRTRGDRPLRFDPPIPVTDLIGRVNERRRGGRRMTLDQGSGSRSNKAFADLASLEWRWFGSPVSAQDLELTLWARGWRRLLLALTTIVDNIVTSIASESN